MVHCWADGDAGGHLVVEQAADLFTKEWGYGVVGCVVGAGLGGVDGAGEIAFEETQDIFDPATAKRLHDHIYAAGGSRDPAALYESFRGRLPTPDALLRRRGLLDAASAIS